MGLVVGIQGYGERNERNYNGGSEREEVSWNLGKKKADWLFIFNLFYLFLIWL